MVILKSKQEVNMAAGLDRKLLFNRMNGASLLGSILIAFLVPPAALDSIGFVGEVMADLAVALTWLRIDEKASVTNFPSAATALYLYLWLIAPFFWVGTVINFSRLTLYDFYNKTRAAQLVSSKWSWVFFLMVLIIAMLGYIVNPVPDANFCRGCTTENRFGMAMAGWASFWFIGSVIGLIGATIRTK